MCTIAFEVCILVFVCLLVVVHVRMSMFYECGDNFVCLFVNKCAVCYSFCCFADCCVLCVVCSLLCLYVCWLLIVVLCDSVS